VVKDTDAGDDIFIKHRVEVNGKPHLQFSTLLKNMVNQITWAPRTYLTAEY